MWCPIVKHIILPNKNPLLDEFGSGMIEMEGHESHTNKVILLVSVHYVINLGHIVLITISMLF
jgi:hypothetical protein